MNTATVSTYTYPGIRGMFPKTEEERLVTSIAREFHQDPSHFVEFITKRNEDTGKLIRDETIRLPRQITQALVKHATPKPLAEIGLKYGPVDHATVLHSCRTVSRDFHTNKEFKARILRILDASGLQRIVSKL